MFAKRMDVHVHYQAKWLIRSDNVKVKNEAPQKSDYNDIN